MAGTSEGGTFQPVWSRQERDLAPCSSGLTTAAPAPGGHFLANTPAPRGISRGKPCLPGEHTQPSGRPPRELEQELATAGAGLQKRSILRGHRIMISLRIKASGCVSGLGSQWSLGRESQRLNRLLGISKD